MFSLFSFNYMPRQSLSKPFAVSYGATMRILISNDDGIYSHNLHLLYTALLRAGHDVRAVAPAEQHSGAGCCLTVHGPILTRRVRLDETEGGPFEGIAVSGTPADCVILALRGLMPEFNPDLVISGINFGPNAGQDVFFSGTVGAAIQATRDLVSLWPFPTAPMPAPRRHMPTLWPVWPRHWTGTTFPGTASITSICLIVRQIRYEASRYAVTVPTGHVWTPMNVASLRGAESTTG